MWFFAGAARRCWRCAAGLDVSAEMVWGMRDPILAKGLPVMTEMFPNAPVIETDAGHFLQEEVPEVIAAAALRLLEALQTP